MGISGGEAAPQPGDLGRRVAQRRHELGLSREQVAARARIDPGYLQYLEHRAAQITAGTALRLAAALETSAAELLGGALERPSGHGPASARPRLEVLDAATCQRLLAPGGVGRFVFNAEDGPVALPVNYQIAGHDIVFRTTETSSLARAADRALVSFEVDHLDDAISQGWSILVSGRIQRVHDPTELDQLQDLGIQPWAGDSGGERNVYLRLVPSNVSGRRIHGH
jgi:transcriptional regulator with XRE-family HTH domain